VASFDVIVVGGGIIGASVAWELARAGLRVVLCDRQQPGLEASWAAAGMLAPGAETPDSLAVAPLGKLSLELYPQFVAAVEADSGRCVGFAPTGALHLFFGTDAERECAQFIGAQTSLGLAAQPISSEQPQRQQPGLSAQARAAVWLPHEACVDNRALTQAVLEAARSKGAQVRAGTAIESLLVVGQRVAGVRVAGGEQIRAATVVVAAGSFTGTLAAFAPYAPTRPVRGQMLALRCHRVRIDRMVRSARGYIVPRADGRLICGSTSEDAGYEKRVTPEGLQHIRAAVVELVPALDDASVVETWSGLRPDTPDHLPILGPADLPGLFFATGHYRNGILLAPITAKLLRDWIVEGKVTLDVARYSPMRFQKKGAVD
jgi:glycine oxidase